MPNKNPLSTRNFKAKAKTDQVFVFNYKPLSNLCKLLKFLQYIFFIGDCVKEISASIDLDNFGAILKYPATYLHIPKTFIERSI